MKVSEAIRLGSMLRPQGFGGLWTGMGETHSCALGAAFDALGCGFIGLGRPPLKVDLWLKDRATCPTCGPYVYARREEIIAHLNDRHRWTRERIADWVESIERTEHPVAESAEILSTAACECSAARVIVVV